MEINYKQSLTKSLEVLGEEYATKGTLNTADILRLLSMVEILLATDNISDVMYHQLYQVLAS